ncbi:MAG: biotin--[acetyl-CoA-carboxylase] ligase, partial [Planctomycetales bacterium]|nr:biotin--[acetyl-CoA-carboxylase] ligase [Planctomycetales bacterium]
MSDALNHFGSADLATLRRSQSLAALEFHETIESTNDRARDLAAQADAALPALVVAGLQTAGRGRGANRWWAGRGSLAFSLAIDIAAYSLARRRLPMLSLATAVAVGEALLAHDDRLDIRWKWPNDVFAGERKLAGILIEPLAARPERIVVGIG